MEGILTKMNREDIKPDSEYMKLVGSLLYAALVTRPDIAFAVQSLGKHLQAGSTEHSIAAKRVLRYLKGTREVGLKYTGKSTGSFTLVGYADADYAGDKDNRRSTSGYTFTLSHGDNIATIDWRAKQQDVVALSSAESELISACSATQTAVYIRQLLMDLGFKQDEPTVIMEDNQACIAMSNNQIIQKRTKHYRCSISFCSFGISCRCIRDESYGSYLKSASYGINCCGSYIMIRSTSGGDANIRMT
ncbi:copia-type polyprotein [Nannochloropsis gaditana]|uniref:Copia-type polyprotein n=1 Tax=Nannochloropsis gaditana TaxID=72520 RepID=W7TWS7_9STRA|nr:copia-type polyprotein [Nannochloropsis gaditana]